MPWFVIAILSWSVIVDLTWLVDGYEWLVTFIKD